MKHSLNISLLFSILFSCGTVYETIQGMDKEIENNEDFHYSPQFQFKELIKEYLKDNTSQNKENLLTCLKAIQVNRKKALGGYIFEGSYCLPPTHCNSGIQSIIDEVNDNEVKNEFIKAFPKKENKDQ
jgi:hypothetical protein